VAELAVCGKRAVLIPYPFAADNHQEHNARSLAKQGGGEVIVQKDLTPARLAAVIQRFACGRAGTMPPLASTAAEEIVRACKEYVRQSRK
jgi:UDP-N-acetylglucosamine--N-acetylmuramyl-(pentapeptide) pyrophosphoryl-undecaprenol N-acetylglucosamine transferase